MKRPLMLLPVLSVTMFFFFTVAGAETPSAGVETASSGSENTSAGAELSEAPETPAVPARELTKDEILSRLNELFQYRKDLMGAIPEVSEKEGENGAAFFYNGVELNKLNKETLMGLLRNVNRHISQKNYEQFQRQQKTLKQIRDLNRMQQADRTRRMLKNLRQTSGPVIPKIYTPTKIPKTYKPPRPYNPRRQY